MAAGIPVQAVSAFSTKGVTKGVTGSQSPIAATVRLWAGRGMALETIAQRLGMRRGKALLGIRDVEPLKDRPALN